MVLGNQKKKKKKRNHCVYQAMNKSISLETSGKQQAVKQQWMFSLFIPQTAPSLDVIEHGPQGEGDTGAKYSGGMLAQQCDAGGSEGGRGGPHSSRAPLSASQAICRLLSSHLATHTLFIPLGGDEEADTELFRRSKAKRCSR